MKRKYFIFGMIIFITIIFIIIFSIIMFKANKNNKQILYRCSYVNYAWGTTDYGYIIYNNGNIEEFDKYDKDKKLKKAKISNEELEELIRLSLLVQSTYVGQNSILLADSGQRTEEIYNQDSKKWIRLLESGEYNNGKNYDEQSDKIL